ncbi:MAG: hypothetical protein Q4F30_00585 [Akkermansia sp.]|nr:hypothetical protein [Akkermansia sp.]
MKEDFPLEMWIGNALGICSLICYYVTGNRLYLCLSLIFMLGGIVLYVLIRLIIVLILNTKMTLTELLGEKANLHLPNNVMKSIMLELQNPENKCTFDADTYIEPICTLEYKEYIIYFYPTHQGYTKLNNGEYEHIKYFQSPSFNKFINENKLREELWGYCTFPNQDKQIRNYLKQSLLRFLLKKE